MFYLTSLTKSLSLNPQDLDTDIKAVISEKIRDLEGTIVGSHGYVVSVLEFDQEGRGFIDNETGKVNFETNYNAIIFRPIQNEILDAVPDSINEYGIFYRIGPMNIFVSQYSISENLEYDFEENVWRNDKDVIEIGKKSRLKIVALRINSDEITALGELCE